MKFKPDSLRSRILRGGSWTIFGHLSNQAIRLASNLVMTRLLMPEMFGIMALANVLLIGLQLFSDLGLTHSILQSRRGHDPTFINTVWTIQVVRGAILWLLALLIALALYFVGYMHWFPAGSVYAEPILPYVIAALSINALITGFESTKRSTAWRNLAFGRNVLIDIASQVAGIVVMMAWVFFQRSIWALVVGSIISSILKVVLSHRMFPGTPNQFRWEKDAVHEVIHFGKWVFLTSILGFLSANGDRLMLGGLTNASTLGVYVIALFMVGAIQELFSKVIGSVAYPALCEVARTRPYDLKSTYYKFRMPIDLMTLFATGFLFVAGHLLILGLYDARYAPAGRMLEILSLSIFEIRFGLAGQCFMALGKPKLLAPVIFVRMLALYLIMPLAFSQFGLDGALWIIGTSVLFTLPVTIYFKIRLGLFDIAREILVLPALVAGYLSGLLVLAVVRILGFQL